jgi:hypothetical protein
MGRTFLSKRRRAFGRRRGGSGILTGQKHKHWLEMLGFELFKQTA